MFMKCSQSSVVGERSTCVLWRSVRYASHTSISNCSISSSSDGCSSSWNSDITQLHREPVDGSEVMQCKMANYIHVVVLCSVLRSTSTTQSHSLVLRGEICCRHQPSCRAACQALNRRQPNISDYRLTDLERTARRHDLGINLRSFQQRLQIYSSSSSLFSTLTVVLAVTLSLRPL